jgi:catechol 2,3-dioxygenase-like lactoylglutathione lyase family enzyme
LHSTRGSRAIGYITVGTNDLTRAAAFYDALLGELGAKRLWEFGALARNI